MTRHIYVHACYRTRHTRREDWTLMIQGIKKSTTSIGPRPCPPAATEGPAPAPRVRQWECAAEGAVAQRPLVTWPASSSLSSESPVLQGPSWPQRPHGPSHGDLLDHALADVDVVPLDSDGCRLTTHVLVVLPVLQGRTDRVTAPGAVAPPRPRSCTC